MGPWEYFGIFEYPDLETAFRVLGKIAKLEMFETETFPAEEVKAQGVPCPAAGITAPPRVRDRRFVGSRGSW